MALDFELTHEQKRLKQKVFEMGRKFSHLIEDCDRESTAPLPLHEEMGRRNWIVPFVPVEFGGRGQGAIEFAIITEEISRVGFMGPNTMAQVAKSLMVAGTEDQKRKYLPKLCNGEMISAVAISEPQAGTSWDQMKTTAVKRGKKYLLNGHKAHINYAIEAGVLMVYAKTAKGISVFLVDRETPGISFMKTNPIGLRMEPLADVFFTDCEIPANTLLGQEGQVLHIFIPAFNLSRIGNASRLLGISRGAFDAAIQYAQERRVGKHRVTEFQGIRWIVADFYSKIELASLMRDKAAWKLDQGEDPALEVAMAKLAAANVAEEVTSKIFSLTGAWGLLREQPFERFWRDAMVGKVGGGSVELLKNFISRRVLGKSESPQRRGK